MKGFLVHHNLGPLNAFVMAELARQFQGCFIGLQAGGAEKNIAQARDLHQFLGQCLLMRYVVIVGGVDQPSQLVLQRGHQLGVVVAQCVDGNAAERIQVLFAVDIPDAAALAMRQGNWQAAIGWHHMGGRGLWQLGGGVHGFGLRGLSKNKAAQTGLGRQVTILEPMPGLFAPLQIGRLHGHSRARRCDLP